MKRGHHVLKLKIANLIRTQGIVKTVLVLMLLTLSKLSRIKAVSKIKLTFHCSHGYIFTARVEDWWRFIDHFEPKTTAFIERTTKASDVIIDIGAHIGIHTIHFAKRAKLVIAIEPEPENFSLLKINILANKLNNVIALPIATSNHDGLIRLCMSSASGAHTVEAVNNCVDELIVKCKRIDSLLRILGINRIDIVKIDVEGHEYKVINGMQEILAKSPPRVLIIEVDKDSELPHKLMEIFKHMLVLDKWDNRLNIALIRI